MKICILDQGEIFGGAECFTLDIIRLLPKDKFEIHICVSKNIDQKYESYLRDIPMISIYKINIAKLKPVSIKNLFSFIRSVLDFSKIIKKNNIDYVYTNTVRAHLVGGVAARLRKTRLLWVLHDFTFPKKLLKSFIKIPESIICVSSEVKEYVRNICGKKYDKKFTIIPNGVIIDEKLKSTKNELFDIDDKKFVFSDQNRYVGIVGRIDIWKGQDVFVRAVNSFNKQYKDNNIHFLVVGGITATSKDRKEYADNLFKYVKENNIKNISFLGHQDINEILPRLSILVQASTQPEPFGRTTIEAFNNGVPVIASNIGALRQIIQHGVNGLSFEPGNFHDLSQKVALLLDDKHLYNNIKINADRDVRVNYNLLRVVENFIDVINRSKK